MAAPLRHVAQVIQSPAAGRLLARAEVMRHAPLLAGLITQGELRVDRELLGAAPQLRVVASASVGVDALDLALLSRRGIYACNAPGPFVEATADFTIGIIIAALRRVTAADRYVRGGRWRGFEPGRWDGARLRQKTLGLVGYGAIGRAVAVRAAAFGLEVIHHQRTRTGHASKVSLRRLLAVSDIVSLHTPLNRDSRGLFNATRLRQMKRGAWLINVSRGPVVDEAALIRALQSGHLAGAALDVFAREPAVPAALRRLDNVILTPHIGGGTLEGRRDACAMCVRNVVLVLQDRRPDNLMNHPRA